jgi:hypothetical protein
VQTCCRGDPPSGKKPHLDLGAVPLAVAERMDPDCRATRVCRQPSAHQAERSWMRARPNAAIGEVDAERGPKPAWSLAAERRRRRRRGPQRR